MQYFIFQHFFSPNFFFLLYKKCWVQYVCFHESVGFCNFIDESVLISIGHHREWLYHHFCFFETKQKIFFQPNCILTSKTWYMKQINVLSTIFTSALLWSGQYGLIINIGIYYGLVWHWELIMPFGGVIGGTRNDCWKKNASVAWKFDELKGSTSLHDDRLLNFVVSDGKLLISIAVRLLL